MQTLFDTLPHNRTTTSVAAAERKARTGTADTDRNRIAAWLHEHREGTTRDELERALGINGNSVRPRCVELLGHCNRYLERGGVACVYETDETRPTPTGSPARVLRHRRWRAGS